MNRNDVNNTAFLTTRSSIKWY